MIKIRTCARNIQGKIEYVLGWLIGIPVPILILVYLIRGN